MHPLSTEERPVPATRSDIAAFYDNALQHRLRDYVYGNERIAAAIALARTALHPSTKRVLEVGCGVGISAAALADAQPGPIVHGVDLSPRCIDAASRLFARENLIFEVNDLRAVPRLAPYDVISILDVYEHIPRDAWPQFNAVIAAALGPEGRLVVTPPPPLYQDYLARNNPDGLQIVDESVQLEDLLALARDTGGVVTFHRLVSIWNDHDYAHTIIERNPTCLPRRVYPRDRGWRRIMAGLRARAQRMAESRATARRREHVHRCIGSWI
jgi:protein-L-isoaspartate O-methyltransferase